jgi:hypothetical protein
MPVDNPDGSTGGTPGPQGPEGLPLVRGLRDRPETTAEGRRVS